MRLLFSMLLYFCYIRPLQKMNASFKDNVCESHIIAHYGMNSYNSSTMILQFYVLSAMITSKLMINDANICL